LPLAVVDDHRVVIAVDAAGVHHVDAFAARVHGHVRRLYQRRRVADDAQEKAKAVVHHHPARHGVGHVNPLARVHGDPQGLPQHPLAAETELEEAPPGHVEGLDHPVAGIGDVDHAPGRGHPIGLVEAHVPLRHATDQPA